MELFTQLILGLWAILVFTGLVFFFAEYKGGEVKDWLVTAWYYPFIINVVLTFIWVELTIFGA